MYAIFEVCGDFERILKITGAIPLVSTVSAVGRGVLANCQGTLGGACLFFGGVGGVACSLVGQLGAARRCFLIASHGLYLIGHSILNNIRAVIEFIPIVNLLGLAKDLTFGTILAYPTAAATAVAAASTSASIAALAACVA